MNYTEINSKTIDRWVEERWEWGNPVFINSRFFIPHVLLIHTFSV